MDKIPLRTYLKEIENLIDKGDNDQAIAHCRHILKAYPKNLATYRLLGKAYLESRRYGDAADVFQRVLSGTPDDFVSHVGMSIIREDESNQDAAIWHMERAFEIQPYNSAIQDELRRLYGQRDGLEPPKVRLTRGALARMYARGNLYQQAIGELRAALAEDSKRSDLQVLLARMYFMAGQKVEAVETCSILLKKLPYCLEANRIISTILPETERKEESQVYRERVMSLDPYLVLASPYETSAEGVRDQVVVIERLNYQEGQMDEASQPAWASSLGVKFDEFKSADEPVPDWLQAISDAPAAARPTVPTQSLDEEQTSAEESIPENTPFLSQDAELIPSSEEDDELPSWISLPDQTGSQGPGAAPAQIPQWMKEAGWESSSGTAESSLPAFDYPEGEDEGGLEKGEMPPWLQELAPEELDKVLSSSGEEAILASMPWLQEAAPESDQPIASTEASSEWLEELGAKSGEPAPDTPDWLKELGDATEEVDESESQAAADEPAGLQTGEDVHDQAGVIEESTLDPAEPADQMPDWLKELGPEEGEAFEAEAFVPESADEEVFEAEPVEVEMIEARADIPEALIPEPTGVEAVEPEAFTEDEVEPEAADLEPAEAETVWEGVSLGTADLSATTLSETQEEEGIPDWYKEVDEVQAEFEGIDEQVSTPLEDQGEESLIEDAVPSEEIPDWLKEAGDEKLELELPESELIEAHLDQDEQTGAEAFESMAAGEEIPDWLKELGTEDEGKSQVEDAPEGYTSVPIFDEASLEEVLPAWMQEINQEMEETRIGEAESDEGEPEQIGEELEPAEEMPAWLRELSQRDDETDQEELQAEELEPADAQIGVEPLDEIPAWLQEMEQENLEPAPPAKELTGWETSAARDMEVAQGDEDEQDWLQIIGEKPLSVEPSIDDSLQIDQPDYSPEDLDALLADTQPVFVGGGEPQVPFNEILEEIDAGMRTEVTADEIQDAAEVGDVGEFEALPGDGLEGIAPGIFGAALAAAETETESFERGSEESEGQEIQTGPEGTVWEDTSLEDTSQPPAFELDDQEASLAWLESLAAKHGVSEDELFTSPEERPADHPFADEIEETEAIQDIAEPGERIETGLPGTVEEPEDQQPDSEIDADTDWIQEASLAESNLEGRGEVPDWLKELDKEDLEQLEVEGDESPMFVHTSGEEPGIEAPAADSLAGEAGEAEIPDWLRDMQEEAEQELSQRQETEQEFEQAVPPLDDSDAAMAWLESLAAKQGVSEDELFTSPEERQETPPAWIEAEEEEDAQAAIFELEEVGIPTEMEEQIEAPVVEEADLWVEQIEPQEAVEGIEAVEISEPAAAEISAALEAEEMGLVEEQPEPQEAVEDIEAVEISEPAAAEISAALEAEEIAETEQPELPEWLAEPDSEQAEEVEWAPPAEPVKAALREPRPGTAPLSRPPSEPVDINKASLVDLETLPGVGFILAQNILTYRDAFGHYNEVEDLIKVPGINPAILAEIREYLTVPPVKEARKQVEPELLDETQSSLLVARNKLAQGDVEGTVAQYSKLIKNRELLPEIIRDMKEALYRFPLDVGLWQVLGDAYMRDDQLTEALEAYTKAEELLK
jgi:competence ComEA-like helix-hairpin-helix protein